MTLLAMREVSKSYPDGLRPQVVLDQVSFAIDAGETIGVQAERLAGKTTLLEVAAGLRLPDSGSVYWEGRDLARMSADQRARHRRRGGIAVVSCDWRPVDSTSVLEHVAKPLYSDGLTMRRADACARRALEWVGAPQLGHWTTDRLGLSERVRVELARALARRPRLLLVDEPALLPRPSDAYELYALLHGLPRRFELALIIASEELAALHGTHRLVNLDRELYTTDARRKVVQLRPAAASQDVRPMAS